MGNCFGDLMNIYLGYLDWVDYLYFDYHYLMIYLDSNFENSKMLNLFSYLLTVYISTVLARKRMLSEAEILPALWSWRQVLSGNRYVLYMVIENIIMLMPMGLLLPFIINKRNAMIQTILFGFAFSLFIEVSQKVLNVGYFEVDDLLNNTIGVVLGCAASSGLKKMLRIEVTNSCQDPQTS